MRLFLHKTYLVGILLAAATTCLFIYILPLTSSTGVILLSQPDKQDVSSAEICHGISSDGLTPPREPKYDKVFHLLKGQLSNYNKANAKFVGETSTYDLSTGSCPYIVRYTLHL